MLDDEKGIVHSFIAVGHTNIVGSEPRGGGIRRQENDY